MKFARACPGLAIEGAEGRGGAGARCEVKGGLVRACVRACLVSGFTFTVLTLASSFSFWSFLALTAFNTAAIVPAASTATPTVMAPMPPGLEMVAERG